MVSYTEASSNGKTIPNEWLFRLESCAMCSHSRENFEPNIGGSGCNLNGFEWIGMDLSGHIETIFDCLGNDICIKNHFLVVDVLDLQTATKAGHLEHLGCLETICSL